MNKKVISLVLALVMVLGTFTSVFAEPVANAPKKEAPKKEETKKEAPKDGEKVEKIVGKDNKIQYIIDKKFVEGYEDGSMGYDKNITRAEITRLLVLANGNEALAKSLQGAMKIYTDVDTKHWANGVISVGTTRPSAANGIAMLAGYPDKSFKPERNVTYAELAKMLVVLVKKDLTADMVKNAIWATSWMTWAAELGILEDVTIANSNDFATRADAFTMVYNALYCMKYFQRTPVNETLGILSHLKNNELTINQGDKAKTFKIAADSVYVLYSNEDGLDVNADNAKNYRRYSKVVKVRAIDNPEYYYGSLIRVLTNDKGEVTHILELGNPAKLALGNNEATPDKQSLIKGQFDPSFPANAGAELGKLVKAIADKVTGQTAIKWEVLTSMKSVDEYTNELIKRWSYTGQGWWRVDPNTRWTDVADATAETKLIDMSPVQNFVKEVKLADILQAINDYNAQQNGPNAEPIIPPRVIDIVKAVYSQSIGDIYNAQQDDPQAWGQFLLRVRQAIAGATINGVPVPNREELADTVITILNGISGNIRIPNAFGILAKVDYSGGDAKAIEFYGGIFTKPTVNQEKNQDPNNFQAWDYIKVKGWMPAQELLRARLTSKTRYFVADAGMNQMTEVSGVDEALRILGNTRASNWFSDVYVGYDTYGNDPKHYNSNNPQGYNEAKVVVFNSVQKSNNNGSILRVTNESTSKYNVTLENTSGEKQNINISGTRFSYPFDFNDAKFDVVKYYNNDAYGHRFITLIDSSKTSRYPIVNVYDVDGMKIKVRDVNGATAALTLDADYDQFLKTQSLEGKNIQFRTTSNNDGTSNVVEIVSIVGMAPKGSLEGVVGYNEGNQAHGIIQEINNDAVGGWYNVRIKTDKTIYDDSYRPTDFFRISIQDAQKLMVGDEVRFKVKTESYGSDRYFRAYDFEILNRLPQELLDAVTVAAFNNDADALAKAIIRAKVANWPAATITAAEDLGHAASRLSMTPLNIQSDDKTALGITSTIKTNVETAVGAAYDVKVELVNPKTTYTAGEQVKAKVTLTVKGNTDVKPYTVEVTGAVA